MRTLLVVSNYFNYNELLDLLADNWALSTFNERLDLLDDRSRLLYLIYDVGLLYLSFWLLERALFSGIKLVLYWDIKLVVDSYFSNWDLLSRFLRFLLGDFCITYVLLFFKSWVSKFVAARSSPYGLLLNFLLPKIFAIDWCLLILA